MSMLNNVKLLFYSNKLFPIKILMQTYSCANGANEILLTTSLCAMALLNLKSYKVFVLIAHIGIIKQFHISL